MRGMGGRKEGEGREECEGDGRRGRNVRGMAGG